nr:efflux RND transporter periplasmic adaptor subunit [Bacteroidota bacterium]
MKYRKFLTWVFIVLIIVTASFAAKVFISMKPEPSLASYEKSKRLVRTRLVNYNEIRSSLEVPGRLAAGQVVEIISEVQGKILTGSIPLKKGQTFTKGDMLCNIYDEEQILSLKASKSRFLNIMANALPDVKFDFPDKYEAVLAFFESVQINDPMPELPEIEDKTLKIFLASRDILNQYYTIKVAEERLQKYYIRAPFSGTFIEVYLEAGGIANPGTRIAKIIETDILELEIPVEVNDLIWINIGDKVEVMSENRMNSWQGKVKRISEFVDPATQSASVFVELKNNQKKPVYAGMYLIALFEGKALEQSMEIPRQAVFNQDEVFIVVDSTLRKNKINILKINKNTLIFDGLDEGTELVIEPLVNVREGTFVDTDRL